MDTLDNIVKTTFSRIVTGVISLPLVFFNYSMPITDKKEATPTPVRQEQKTTELLPDYYGAGSDLLFNRLTKELNFAKKEEPTNELPTSFAYKIRNEDNLYTLSKKFGIAFQDMLKDNKHFKDPDMIHPGDMVVVNNPTIIPDEMREYMTGSSLPSISLAELNKQDVPYSKPAKEHKEVVNTQKPVNTVPKVVEHKAAEHRKHTELVWADNAPKKAEAIAKAQNPNFSKKPLEQIYSLRQLQEKIPEAYAAIQIIAKEINAEFINVATPVSHETARTFSTKIKGPGYDRGLIQFLPSTARELDSQLGNKYGLSGTNKEVSEKVANLSYEAQTELAIKYLKTNLKTQKPRLEDIACAIHVPAECGKPVEYGSRLHIYLDHLKAEKARLIKLAKQESPGIVLESPKLNPTVIASLDSTKTAYEKPEKTAVLHSAQREKVLEAQYMAKANRAPQVIASAANEAHSIDDKVAEIFPVKAEGVVIASTETPYLRKVSANAANDKLFSNDKLIDDAVTSYKTFAAEKGIEVTESKLTAAQRIASVYVQIRSSELTKKHMEKAKDPYLLLGKMAMVLYKSQFLSNNLITEEIANLEVAKIVEFAKQNNLYAKPANYTSQPLRKAA